MGFHIRKSIKAGPFRFNLSSSGVGVSVGVPGLRIGTGPRGNYVHMGRGVLQYRASLSSSRRKPSAPVSDWVESETQCRTHAGENFERIESSSVLAMTEESAAGLLEQIRAAETRQPIMPLAAGATVLALVAMVAAGMSDWLTASFAALGAGVTAWARMRDIARRAVVLFYDLAPDARLAYEELHVAFARLAGVQGLWNIEARADIDDRKRNAGATRLVQRQRVRLGMGAPGVIRTNIDVPAIPCGQETLHFFPDRLLVSSRQGIGAVSYDQLRITVESWPFVEAEPVPADATSIGHTWKYVNRDGGPDRRFADNRQLPILLYEQISFTSPAGLHEVLQFSRTGGGLSFQSAIETLGKLACVQRDQPRQAGAEPAPVLPAVKPQGLSGNPQPVGTFEGTVSGDVDGRLKGRAVFGTRSNERGEDIFLIVLRHVGREGEGEHAITVSNALAGVPAPGRYSFGNMGPRTFVAMYTHETDGGSSGTYLPTEGGTLEIEAATGEAVRGWVEFRAEGTNTYNLWAVDGHVRLWAAFSAEPYEGDPYELSRLPGELRAFAEVDESEAGLVDTSPDLDALSYFADGVAEHLVVRKSLREVLQIFAGAGLTGLEVRRVEALLFAALPFETLIEVGHFGGHGTHLRAAFRQAIAKQAAIIGGVAEGAMVELVRARFAEYEEVVFEPGQFTVREDGMVNLAIEAYRHIIGGESDDYALLQELFTYFASMSEALGYGERLAQLYAGFLEHGNELWNDEE